MKKTFIYKNRGDNWFWLSAALLFFLFTGYIFLKIFQAEKLNWIAVLLPIFFGLLGTILFRVFFLRLQYHQFEQNKVITVDNSKKEISIIESGRETIINKNIIEEVEIYSSWNSIPLFSDLGYIKFILSNGDIVKITKFIADDIDLQSLITGKPVKRKINLMNPIK